MNNDTTVASNDESRKEATNNKVAKANELKTNYVNDEDVRNDIKKWTGEEKTIIIAAIDWEAVIANELEQSDGTGSSDAGNTDTSSSGSDVRRRRIRVGSKVSKSLNSLIIDPLITVGAKAQNEKTKVARNAKKIKQQEKEQEKE